MLKSNLELYEHNQETYENIKDIWKRTNKVAILQATGTGKTYVIARILEDYKKLKTLVLAPTCHILNHIKESNIANEYTEYMTYAKLTRMPSNQIKLLKYDLIVLDEFHRCGAKQWGKSVEKLLDSNINSKVLGATATHIRYLDGATDMAKELFDDYIASKIDLVDAINKGLIPMPIYVGSLYDVNRELECMRSKIKGSKNSKSQKLELLNKLEEAKAWSLVNGVPSILRKYITEDKNKFIVFCKNKNHLNKMKLLMQSWFKEAEISRPVKMYEVSYVNGVKSNNEELISFSNGDTKYIHLAFSIDILNEGVHISDVSGVFLMRETSSPIIFYQQIGRAMSVGMNKSPLILDFVNNFNSLRTDEFKNMLYQSREKLRNRDEDIKEVDFTIFDESRDFKAILDEIDGNLVDSWDVMYLKLKEFYVKNGHTCINRKDPKYKSLYKWINKQRVLYSKKELDIEKIKLLEEIEFIWNTHDKKWMDMYNELLDFYIKNGHTRVLESINKRLSAWCTAQRDLYNKNKLKKYQIDLLEEVEFIWKVLDTVWNDRYKELIDFKKNYGHTNVPRRFLENPKLANWCQMQRANYKARIEKRNLTIISEERIRLLEEIGFIWNLEDYAWCKNLENLRMYYEETSDYLHKGNMKKTLRDWTARQRQAYRNGKLSQERIDKLTSVGFVWDLLFAK